MTSSVEHSKETRTKSKESSKSRSNEGDAPRESGSHSSENNGKSKTTTENVDNKQCMASVANLALENMGLDSTTEGSSWSTKWESITAIVSFITCSGNFWFFPFLCGYYGGWFPYQFTFCFFFISVPLMYMEMALGQYSSASPLSVFSRMAPAMAGLSAGMCFILVFRTVSLATWASYDLTITVSAAQSAWTTPPWTGCPIDQTRCVDYKLAEECTWTVSRSRMECDEYQQSLISTRGFLKRMSPFITFVTSMMFKRSVVLSDWTPPDFKSVVSCTILWLAVGVISIRGSKVLGKTGVVAITLLFLGTLTFTVRGIMFGDTADVFTSFFYEKYTPTDPWIWVWSWADAAAHAVRALNIGCGGIQKH